MAVKLGLWSLSLVPGEKYPLYVKHDFQVTNAALTEDLASPNGRTVLKVSHFTVNPAIYGDSDSGSEIDSDLADSDLDDEDQFELDEQEGFKEVEKKPNGVADVSMEQEEDDDEEDEEDSDDEDDEFSDISGEEVTSVICALTGGRIEQATLNLTFTQGDAIMFEVVGENAIHLMGNYIDQPNQYDSDSDDEHDHEHDDYDSMFGGDSDSDDEEGAAFIEALKEPEPKAKKSIAAPTPVAAEAKPKKAASAAPTPAPAAAAAAPADKKRKAEAIDSPAAKPAAAAAAGVAGETLSKAQKKKLNKKAKTEEAPAAAPAAAAAKPEVASAKAAGVKRTLPSGLIIEDIKKGDGPAAKGGKRLSMRYIGKLTDGKQFDANTAGKPFSFVLGRGEVIKGWDEGLMGMNVGGERRLTIPAQLAYGSQKIPGIPKNSTLKFEVKLLAVN